MSCPHSSPLTIDRSRPPIDGSSWEVKEEFCGLCAAIPLALAGSGATIYGSKRERGTFHRRKRIALVVGLLSVLISIALTVWVFTSECNVCLGPS